MACAHAWHAWHGWLMMCGKLLCISADNTIHQLHHQATTLIRRLGPREIVQMLCRRAGYLLMLVLKQLMLRSLVRLTNAWPLIILVAHLVAVGDPSTEEICYAWGPLGTWARRWCSIVLPIEAQTAIVSILTWISNHLYLFFKIITNLELLTSLRTFRAEKPLI